MASGTPQYLLCGIMTKAQTEGKAMKQPFFTVLYRRWDMGTQRRLFQYAPGHTDLTNKARPDNRHS
jgi:hypothetical protein